MSKEQEEQNLNEDMLEHDEAVDMGQEDMLKVAAGMQPEDMLTDPGVVDMDKVGMLMGQVGMLMGQVGMDKAKQTDTRHVEVDKLLMWEDRQQMEVVGRLRQGSYEKQKPEEARHTQILEGEVMQHKVERKEHSLYLISAMKQDISSLQFIAMID